MPKLAPILGPGSSQKPGSRSGSETLVKRIHFRPFSDGTKKAAGD